MSFILEALNRAERERKLARPPDLTLVLQDHGMIVPRRRRWPWIVLIGALLANAVLLAVLFWPKPDPPVASSTAEPAKVAAPLRQQSRSEFREPGPLNPLPFTDAIRREGKQRTPSSAERLPSLPNPPVHSPAVTVPAVPLALGARGAQPEREPPEHLAMAKSEERVSRLEPEGFPLDAPSIPEEGSASVQAERIPLLHELPPETRERLRELNISGHVYREGRSKCFVFINSQSYRVGDRIGENGPLLEKITPEGVIVDYGSGRAHLLVGK